MTKAGELLGRHAAWELVVADRQYKRKEMLDGVGEEEDKAEKEGLRGGVALDSVLREASLRRPRLRGDLKEAREWAVWLCGGGTFHCKQGGQMKGLELGRGWCVQGGWRCWSGGEGSGKQILRVLRARQGLWSLFWAPLEQSRGVTCSDFTFEGSLWLP